MKASRKPATRRKLRGRRRGEDDNDDDVDEKRGVGFHWYVISFSILLVVGFSFVNFLALPDIRAHSLLSAVLIRRTAAISGDPHSEPQRPGGPSDEERIALQQAAQEALQEPMPIKSGNEQSGDLWQAPKGPLLRKDSAPDEAPQPRQKLRGASVPETLSQRAKAASKSSAVTALGQSVASEKGGVAEFSGESWLELAKVVDADEISFRAWIYLPNVPESLFPLSSESMKTIISTKKSGCASQGQASSGWAFFVHEWSTSNRQLRLSWTDSGNACHEIFSTSDLVPFDEWVLVGFSLSKASNTARIVINHKVVVDTQRSIGSYARASQQLAISQANVAARSISREPPLVIGAHRKTEDIAQSHCFLGYIGDMQVFTTAPVDSDKLVQLLSSSYKAVVDHNLATEEAIKFSIRARSGEQQQTNERDGIPLATHGDQSQLSFVAYSPKMKHPILQNAEGVENGEPGPTMDPPALRQTWPEEWTSKFSDSELLESQKSADPWADDVRNAMRHTWLGYRKKAWGHDDIEPVRGAPKDWCQMAVTMLDGLSTLWVMGLKAEFNAAATWLESANLPKPGAHGTHSFFEITIRALGGLLSAYSLSNRPVFLQTARRLADNMMSAFGTQSGMPRSTVDIGTGASAGHSWMSNIVLAEATTLQVEFRYLSHATGDRRYADAADRSMNAVLTAAGNQGLIPIYVRESPVMFVGSKKSMGAMGDSYYEYLIKQWIQSGKKEDRLKDTWKRAMNEMMDQMVVKTKGGLSFLAELEGGQQRMRMDHLACFVAGMLMLGSRNLPKNEVDTRWEPFAAELTRTCYEMYARSPSGLAPEYVSFNTWAEQGHDMDIPGDAPHNLLRPEAIEAVFYMWYYTGDPKYRNWAVTMWKPFVKHCKVKFGFSAAADVRRVPPPLKNSQESFWLAETLKYFYLVFSPRNTINLEEWVFNTEAQPLRVWS